MVLETIELKVGDFMTSEPITRDSDVLFPVAISVMANHGIGNLIIKEKNKPSSLLTEREILSYLVRRGEIPIEPIQEPITQNWREVLICRRCNESHHWVDEQGLPDTFVGY